MGNTRSIRNIVSIIVFALLLLPSLVVGLIGYYFSYERVRDLKMQMVGVIAESKRDQLVSELKSARARLTNFMTVITEKCDVAGRKKINIKCLTSSFEDLIKNESALGLYLFDKNQKEIFSVKTNIILFTELPHLARPHLAQFSNYDDQEIIGAPASVLQFYISTENHHGFRLAAVYSANSIQKIFDIPSALGKTGETFLASGKGIFITKPRYPSQQGRHDHPISAMPMQKCLAGEDTAVLDLDYRDVGVIHGFRIVPEVGNGCIMAHIEQQEAFAVLGDLISRFLIFGIVIIFIILISSFIMGTQVTKKIGDILLDYGKVMDQIKKNESVDISHESIEEFKPIQSAFRGLIHTIGMNHREIIKERNWSDFILANIDDAILELNTEGKIIEVNRKMTQLFGYTKEELLGRNLRIIFNENDVNKFEIFFNNCLEMIEDKLIDSESFEINANSKSNSALIVTVLIKELIKDGQIIFVGIIKDLGPRRILEQKLEQEKAFAIQASKFAALGQITGSIAHEINTPLAAVSLSAQSIDALLAVGNVDVVKIKRHLSMTIRIVDKIKNLIVCIKKMGSNQNEQLKTLTPMNALIEDVKVVSDAILRANGIEFHCIYWDEVAAELPVLINITQMWQVLMSLISNSIDAISSLDERWIRLEVGRDQQNLVLKLSDSGKGIPPVIAQNIFAPFFTTKTTSRGTGIGLSISKRIIEEHGASIEIDTSAFNTTFIIKIPIIQYGNLAANN
jgi:PAS domain S-box-containing protein